MKKKIFKIFPVLAIFMSAGALVACQVPARTGIVEKSESISPSGTAQTEAAQTEAGAATESFDEYDQNALFGLYLELDMQRLPKMEDNMEDYFKHVKFQEDFEPDKEDYDIGYVGSNDMDTIEKTQKLLQEKETLDDLDQAFLALYPSLTELMDVSIKIYNYAELKSYVDDDYAKAEEYHKALWKAYGSYPQAAEEFHAQFVKHSSALLDQEQNQAEKKGLTAQYEALSALKSAIAIQNEMANQNLTNKNQSTMDLTVIKPMYQELLDHIMALTDIEKKNDPLPDDLFPSTSHFKTFMDALKETKVSMTMIMQAVEAKEEIDSIFPGDGSISSYQGKLKELTTAYHGMFHLEYK